MTVGRIQNPPHDAEHRRIAQVVNSSRVVFPSDNLQAELDKGGTIYLIPGIYIASLLNLTVPVAIIGSVGVVLQCLGIAAHNVTSYLAVTISNLTVQNNSVGGIGISLYGCKACIENVTVRYGFDVGLRLERSILTQINHATIEGVVNACLITGDTNTTISGIDCYFRRASDAAVRISATTTDVSFTHCVFEACQRGVIADGVSMLSLTSCYWEACYNEHLICGELAPVSSVSLINPIMIGNAADIASADLTRFDQVDLIHWVGGWCKLPRAALLRTTQNSQQLYGLEPVSLGLPVISDPATRLNWVSANGYFRTAHLSVDQWLWSGGYNLSPGDINLSSGGTVAFYANQAGLVRLAAQRNVQGVLVGGVEADVNGLILLDANGKSWRLQVDTRGVLSTAPIVG